MVIDTTNGHFCQPIQSGVLKLMDLVEKNREPNVITKHRCPVAQMAPVATDEDSLFGYMKDTMRIEGDVMAPVDEEWSALSGDEDYLHMKKSHSLLACGSLSD